MSLYRTIISSEYRTQPFYHTTSCGKVFGVPFQLAILRYIHNLPAQDGLMLLGHFSCLGEIYEAMLNELGVQETGTFIENNIKYLTSQNHRDVLRVKHDGWYYTYSNTLEDGSDSEEDESTDIEDEESTEIDYNPLYVPERIEIRVRTLRSGKEF